MCGAGGTWVRACMWDHYSLCFRDEFVSVIPVSQQICCFFIIYSDVMILKDSWEEVIYLSSDIQDIPHPARGPRENVCFTTQAKSNASTVLTYSWLLRLKLNTKILKKAKKRRGYILIWYRNHIITESRTYLGTNELLGEKLSTKFNI